MPLLALVSVSFLSLCWAQLRGEYAEGGKRSPYSLHGTPCFRTFKLVFQFEQLDTG